MNIIIYFKHLAAMAGVTYLTRMLPLVAVKKKLKNRFFRSFLLYVPFAVLAAMTIPAAFYSTGSFISAIFGIAAAVALSLMGQGLVVVAVAACAAAFIAGVFI